MLALILALSPPALAEPPSASIDVSVGLVTGQLGMGVTGGGRIRHQGLSAFGDVGVAVRGGFLTTAIDAPLFPLVGLADVGVAWTFPLSDDVRLGPIAQANAAVLAATDRDCGGFGCRHALWLGGDDGAGLSYAPAAGLMLDAGLGEAARFEAILGVQPTRIYDISLPFAPRAEVRYTTSGGLRFGVLADRYGARTTFGLEI